MFCDLDTGIFHDMGVCERCFVVSKPQRKALAGRHEARLAGAGAQALCFMIIVFFFCGDSLPEKPTCYESNQSQLFQVQVDVRCLCDRSVSFHSCIHEQLRLSVAISTMPLPDTGNDGERTDYDGEFLVHQLVPGICLADQCS